ncbi:Bug family tripartite tricarboxylate transporter substrate binding protein [Roseomonas populi]|uniref:Tripartite tricarboxylate transporter substrate binding protein n=1 Tax=Roseomonas populi TaxID=3121582 RepID=A0ABT1XCL9_9PROT|nr:tripartite tricarboxylate transporter substrate binding protein [Roseomonas pecuniae]MCR0985158.1 tripartite tricarboxylate transporter substrate binding protein [Roseomonas pecuniae]
MERRALGAGLVAAGLSAVLPRSGRAQANWPGQAVRVVVPFPAGGTADSVPRIVVEGLRSIWQQPVIIDNRPGAAGNIGTAHVANAEPDGYTLLAAPPPSLAINQHLYARLNFDPARLRPVIVMGTSPNIVEVSNKLEVRSLKALIERAKEKPGGINAANQGMGSTSHLTAAMFEAAAGVQFNHVPYNGTAPALNDLVAGHVDLFFDNLSSSLSFHQSGATRILAVCQAERAPQIPDVPTVAETALPGFSAIAWYAIMAPPGTPDAIVEKVNRDAVSVIRQPEVRQRLLDQAVQPVANSPQEAAAFIAAESRLWGEAVRRTGLRL